MDFKNKDFNSKNMFYGRARRIELLKRLSIVTAIITILIIGFSFITRKTSFVNQDNDFQYLKQYFNSRGYTCEAIEKDGGKCYLKGQSTYYNFTRYSTGFEYIEKTDGYILIVRHVLDTYSDISFTTNDNALLGTKNKKFTCSTKDNIIGELEQCTSNSGEKLTSSTYIGVVENAISNINNILDSSGYNKSVLLNEYNWQKK